MNLKQLNELNTFIETEISPAIRTHGGEVKLNRLSDSVAYLELQGACVICPADEMTKKGIEIQITSKFSFVTSVVFESSFNENTTGFKLTL